MLNAPMLATNITHFEEIDYPVLVQPKHDGIRCLIHGGVGYARSGKPIPNRHIQTKIQPWMNGYDGELIIRDRGCEAAQSLVMSIDKYPPETFEYVVFDRHDMPAAPYEDRLAAIVPHVRVETEVVTNRFELARKWDTVVAYRDEGLILRKPGSLYVHGRSKNLMKRKLLMDAEFEIIGFTAHKKVPHAMGAIILAGGHSVGTGFTMAMRRDIWSRREELYGQLARVRYLGKPPRQPVFQGIRDIRDT